MTYGQHVLILKHQSTTPARYHGVINHLVLTGQYKAAEMLVITLEQDYASR